MWPTATARSRKRSLRCSAKARLGGSKIFASSLWLAKEKPVAPRRDEGHAREIERTLEADARGGSSPPFEELVAVSTATNAVEEAIASGKSVWLGATGSATGASKPR